MRITQNDAFITSPVEETHGTLAEIDTNADQDTATLPANSAPELMGTDSGEEALTANELPGHPPTAGESSEASFASHQMLSDQPMTLLCNQQLYSDLSRVDSKSRDAIRSADGTTVPKCEGILLLHVIFFAVFVVVCFLDYIFF